MPIFLLFFVFLPQQRVVQRSALFKRKRKRGLVNMTNEVIAKFIGKNCRISTGTFGTNVIGKIINVSENWLEIETKKGNELINAEYIQSIKIDPS
jgi:hypothetical protein